MTLRGALGWTGKGGWADFCVLSAWRSSQPEDKRMDGNLLPTLIFLPVLLSAVLPSSAGVLEPYDLLYDNAVEAFYSADYESVVRYMEGALSSNRHVRATRVQCRLRCQDQHPFDESFSDLRFFDSVLRRAACMNKCIEAKVGTQSLHKVSEDVVQDFNRRIPYNYLQQAYQKVRRGEKEWTAGAEWALLLWTRRGMVCLAGLLNATCCIPH